MLQAIPDFAIEVSSHARLLRIWPLSLTDVSTVCRWAGSLHFVRSPKQTTPGCSFWFKSLDWGSFSQWSGKTVAGERGSRKSGGAMPGLEKTYCPCEGELCFRV